MPEKGARLTGARLMAQRLLAAGLIRSEDHVRRLVLEMGVDGYVTLTVERVVDDQLLAAIADVLTPPPPDGSDA